MRLTMKTATFLMTFLFLAAEAAAVGAPVFKPSAGNYLDSVTVTISSSTNTATIIYTLDGTDPRTSKTARTYSRPLTIDRNRTIRAVATLQKESSGRTTAAYTVTAPPPSISPSSRAFVQQLGVRLSTKHPLSDIIRYTLDGSEPTTKSHLYVDLGLPLLTLTKSTVVKAKAFRDGANASTTASVFYPRATVLLLHGLNSNPATPWKVLVRELFPGDNSSPDTLCPRVSRAPVTLPSSPCYRADFGSKTVNGVTWSNGDGAQFSDYAADVNGMIDNILRSANAPVIILIGHSRGGLAARSYLQTYVRSSPKLGLLTLGTPHQGSPLGRVPHFYQTDSRHKLTSSEFLAWQKKESSLRFVFAPSTAAMATDHDAQKKPVHTTVSAAIHNLNANVSALSKSTTVIGQINSTGLDLGVDLGPFTTNLLDDRWLKKIADDKLLPGTFDPTLVALRAYILKNLSTEWSRGDGAVPEASADLSRILKFGVITTNLKNKRHSDLSEETGSIMRQLQSLTDSINAKVGKWSVSVATTASVSTPATMEDASVSVLRDQLAAGADARGTAAVLSERVARGDGAVIRDLRDLMTGGESAVAVFATTVVARAGTRQSTAALLDVLNIAPESDAARMARHELRTIGSVTRHDEREAVTDLLLNRLILPMTSDDRALLMNAIAGIGTERGVGVLLDEHDATDEDRRAAAAEALASIRDEDAVNLLVAHLKRPGDPLAPISGETLSHMASPRATAALLDWARQTQDIVTAIRWLSRVRDGESIRMFLGSVEKDLYLSRDVQSGLAAIAKELDRQAAPVVPEE